MNLLEIFGVIVVLFVTIIFWIIVFDDKGEDKGDMSLPFFLVFVLWFGMIVYFKDFFTTPLW